MQGAGKKKSHNSGCFPYSPHPHPASSKTRINRIVAVLHTRNVRAQVRFLVDALTAQNVAPRWSLTI